MTFFVLISTGARRAGTFCAICGRQRQGIALVGHPPAVIMASSVDPPPSITSFCRDCVEQHRLQEGRVLSDERINTFRSERGLAARDFSR
jgi:hypothetical protein